jgi:chemotaxis protein MotB
MASKEAKPTIVVRRKKKRGHGGHHGGVWKIAYADFVTAMMAFFLLMWLLGSTAQGDLHGIAEYFRTPLKVALAGGSGSGDSSSILKGGGQDLTRSAGQVKRGEIEPVRRTINLQAAKAELERRETLKLEALRGKLVAAIDANANLRAFKHQVRIDITPEGLRVQIVDEHNRPMFDTGRALLKDYTREILREIAHVLNDVDHKIALSGHTDAAPYASGEKGYSNWELSADRANASRRELVAAGISENKIIRVVGLAASVPFDPADPFDASNRRISLIVLNKQTEEALSRESSLAEIAPLPVRDGASAPTNPQALEPARDPRALEGVTAAKEQR